MVMEQLTEDAVESKKHGLSYGQYIQKFKPPKQQEERFHKKKAKGTGVKQKEEASK